MNHNKKRRWRPPPGSFQPRRKTKKPSCQMVGKHESRGRNDAICLPREALGTHHAWPLSLSRPHSLISPRAQYNEEASFCYKIVLDFELYEPSVPLSCHACLSTDGVSLLARLRPLMRFFCEIRHPSKRLDETRDPSYLSSEHLAGRRHQQECA